MACPCPWPCPWPWATCTASAGPTTGPWKCANEWAWPWPPPPPPWWPPALAYCHTVAMTAITATTWNETLLLINLLGVNAAHHIQGVSRKLLQILWADSSLQKKEKVNVASVINNKSPMGQCYIYRVIQKYFYKFCGRIPSLQVKEKVHEACVNIKRFPLSQCHIYRVIKNTFTNFVDGFLYYSWKKKSMRHVLILLSLLWVNATYTEKYFY